jgi:uncharacterized protein YjbI with pentapeptide repeats
MRTIDKEELKEILRKHGEWLIDPNKGERANLSSADLRYADLRYADLRSADLRSADLSYADLSYADLSSADLRYAVGNSNQIKTLQTETYVVTYTNTVMAIGCKQYSIKEWKNFKDREIKKMDSKALEFWKKWKPILKKIGVFDND